MKGIKLKAPHLGRKSALGAAAAVAVLGLSLVGGVSAFASAGPGTGGVNLSETSGSLNDAPTWTTTAGCPGAETTSAVLVVVMPDYTTANDDVQNLSNFLTSVTSAITTPQFFEGNSASSSVVTMGTIESLVGASTGQTTEIALQCSSGPAGAGTLAFPVDGFITWTATGFTYAQTPGSGPVTPTVTLSATPNPVQVGNTVTLTATVVAGSSAVTSGSVQFEEGGTDVGTPVALSSSGVATTTTTFTTTGTPSLTANFESSNTSQFNNATSPAVTETVTANNPNAQGELIQVTVPPTGTFSWSVPTPEPVVTLAVSGSTATGALTPGTLADSRTGIAANQYTAANLVSGYDGYPGWSVVGQASDFSNATSHPAGDIPASNLNWTPTTPASGDFVLGSASTGGLGSAQTLATAAEGHGDGSFQLGANLTLAIPGTAPAGLYVSTLTMTADPVANFGL
jgi:Bacterial Ig-like domain (group 3)